MCRRDALAYLLILPLLLAADSHGLRVPDGFAVTEFADNSLAPDAHCLTISDTGRLLVSGRGYLRELIDADGDGRADRALDFAHPIKDGAHGLHVVGDDLYAVGDGGLVLYRDGMTVVGRSRRPELVFTCKTGGEHQAHAVSRGPDGRIYLLVGDGAGVTSESPGMKGPVARPIGGSVVRFSSDLKNYEILADGFRNAYGMDFDADGELFTFDSDNERCVALPWYEPTRCYHVAVGGHHGWLAPQHASTYRRPPYLLDVVPPIATLGRGSPTGVVCYKDTQFPARYRGGLFLLDWTFGVIHHVSLRREGSTFVGTPEVFLKSVGDNGFAPTAAAVDPRTGDLYVSIGGRGTRGAVYRIRHTAGFAGRKAAPAPKPAVALDVAKACRSKDLHDRRRGLEAVLRRPEGTKDLADILRDNAGSPDRGIRRLVAAVLQRLGDAERERITAGWNTPYERTTKYLAKPSYDALSLVTDAKLPASIRLDGVRLVQLAMEDVGPDAAKGTVREGYARRYGTPIPKAVVAALAAAYPTGDREADIELARAVGMTQTDDASIAKRLLDAITTTSSPVDDIHFLIVFSRLRSARTQGMTYTCAAALLALDKKLDDIRQPRDRNWPLRMRELHADLAARDPALNAALLADAAFGSPEHAVWCHAPGFDRKAAARRFIKRSSVPGFAWNADLVALIDDPAVLRKLYGEHGLDDLILLRLSKHALPEDHRLLLDGLTSARIDVVAAAIGAVATLPLPDAIKEAEAVALVRGVRLLPPGKTEDALRVKLLARLARHSAAKLSSADEATDWLTRTYPVAAKSLGAVDGVDVAAWDKRLRGVRWDKGDPQRGKLVYTKASCVGCHSGAAALGPDLAGVAGRFSRDDLFTAILRPSKDVSPRYRTTQLTTAAGKVYRGIIVYEAVDSVLMLTGPGESVRLAHKQIADRRLLPASLMPVGLLDRLRDEEIADLYSYLRAQGAKR